MSDLISRELAVESVKDLYLDDDSTYECPDECNWMIDACIETLRELPSAQPEADEVARDIATIIENEKDMRVVRENAGQKWIAVTKEEMFKAGYEGREIRFRVDGRLFAIRELAQ